MTIYRVQVQQLKFSWHIALIGKLYKISLLQCLPDDSILSIAITKVHCIVNTKSTITSL